MKRQEALRRVLFLKTLPDSTIAAVASCGETRHFGKGEVIFLEKGRCIGLIVVLTGSVKVYKLDARGRELTLDLERPGESVGEVALFDGGNYPANAQAEEDETRLLIVSRERFWDIAGQHPEVMRQALKAMGVRTRKLLQMLEAQALYPVRARLAEYLLRAAEDRTHFRLEETNEAIAGRIGTVREVVSRTLRSLTDTGAIALNDRWIIVHDAAVLHRLAAPVEQT